MSARSMNDITRPKNEPRAKSVPAEKPEKPEVIVAPSPVKETTEAIPDNNPKPKRSFSWRSAVFLAILTAVVVGAWLMREEIINMLPY